MKFDPFLLNVIWPAECLGGTVQVTNTGLCWLWG